MRDDHNSARAGFPKSLNPAFWDGFICPEMPSTGQRMCPDGCLFQTCPKAEGGPGVWRVNELNSIYAIVYLSPDDSKCSLDHNQNLPIYQKDNIHYIFILLSLLWS